MAQKWRVRGAAPWTTGRQQNRRTCRAGQSGGRGGPGRGGGNARTGRALCGSCAARGAHIEGTAPNSEMPRPR